MNLLVMDNVTKIYGDKMILQSVSMGIEKGEKIGVLGINGSGKSSLLKLAVGWEEPDDGKIIRNKDISINFLPQNPQFEPEDTVLGAVVNRIEASPYFDPWSLESEAKSILTRLGIYDFTAPIEQLSGGQRKRVALAAALLNQVDLLVLDEPTNHLDNQAIDWLEKYLHKFSGALLMVTHDRYFLERVTNKIIEIEQAHLYTYPGNWSAYLEKKLERQESQAATLTKKQSLLRKELAWIQRGARARTTKQKARIERFGKLQSEVNQPRTRDLEISSLVSRLGKKIMVLQDISHSFGGKPLIKQFSYILDRHERLGIVGPNGIGKSTLLRMMSGEILPEHGRLEIGSTVRIGYFPQESTDMPDDMRVIDYIREAGEYLSAGKRLLSASQMLETFLFPPSAQWARLQKLSGGEKRRLHLLRILMSAPNVLLLDEPGNDLDIETLIILEDYLDSFPGAVVAVSHDRYFLDRITSKIVVFGEEGQMLEYPGNYSEYLALAASQEGKNEKSEPLAPKQQVAQSEVTRRSARFSFSEQREYEEIDDKISTIEDALKILDRDIDQAGSDFQRLQELTAARQEMEHHYQYLLDRWTYLNELAEVIARQRREGR